MNNYPHSGKTLKKVVRIYNWIGYAIGVLCGYSVGTAVAFILRSIGCNVWLMVVSMIGAATIVGGLIIFWVWVTGLILWTLSDAADDAAAVKEHLGC